VQVRRSPQAAAGRKRDGEELGKSPQLLPWGREVEEYGQRESPPEADGGSYQAEYSERGKATYLGKDLTGVRSPQRNLRPDTVGSDHHKPPSLLGIANKARVDKRHRVRDLYRCLDAALLLNRTTEHWYTQAASCEISSCAVSVACTAATAAVTSGM
jgi:hypothetical protein